MVLIMVLINIVVLDEGVGGGGGALHPMPEEEEEFCKLRPANKTDHLCQPWQQCHMFMKFRQSVT